VRKEVVSSLAEPVGSLWKDVQNAQTKSGKIFVASPLSSTPLPIYEWIIQHASEFENWDKVRFVLMDEMMEDGQYVGSQDQASYEGFAKKHFLNPLEQATGIQLPIIKPSEEQVQQFSPEIDLLILAIGVKGNYANVMPGTAEETGWHIAKLLPEFNQYHQNTAYSGSTFREYGMSLGPQQVLNSKNAVVIISGEKKKELAGELFSHDSFDPQFPLSIIYHPKVQDRVTVFITKDAVV
jgi:glucosamine-6-phosphate deaminase